MKPVLTAWREVGPILKVSTKVTHLSYFLLLLIACGRDQGDVLLPRIHGEYHYLWSPESSEIRQGLAFKAPLDLLATVNGDLIIADFLAGEVHRLDAHGSYVELIGGLGDGPGEFVRPWCLAFDEVTGHLWILDQVFGRINRFDIRTQHSLFLDRFEIPELGTQRVVALCLSGGDSLWASFLYRGNSIHLLQRGPGITRSFGGSFQPADIPVSEHEYFNNGQLHAMTADTLLFIWQAQPQVDFWTIDGGHVSSRILEFPPGYEPFRLPIPGNSGVEVSVYAWGSFYDSACRALFILGIAKFGQPIEILRYSIDDMKLTAIITFELESQPAIGSISAIREGQTIRVYAIDTSTYGIIEFSFEDPL